MKYATVAGVIFGLSFFATAVAPGATRQEQIVTRIERATVVARGRELVIRAEGMGRTPSGMNRAGRLVRRGAEPVLNKEGLLEYNLVFNGIPNYSGFVLKPIKASLKERTVPAGTKGVKIFGEFNEMVALLPQKPKRKSFLPFGKKPREENSGETAGSITGSSPHP
jgi:hypothetical protein